MLTCPMCKKAAADTARACPRCGTDLALLADYAAGLQVVLKRAEALTRRGELAGAVWAYLEVLEVDPENAAARRQVGQVAAAVRQFDKKAPGRRWLERLRRRDRLRRRFSWRIGRETISWPVLITLLLFMGGCFVLGYNLGYQAGKQG